MITSHVDGTLEHWAITSGDDDVIWRCEFAGAEQPPRALVLSEPGAVVPCGICHRPMSYGYCPEHD